MVTSTKAVSGVILVRQVAYDANNHGVSLQGGGHLLVRGSGIQAPPLEK
jgi:hypothetical protein